MSGSIPQEYVGTVVAVVLYSFLCLFATLVLYRKLYLNGDKFTYVSLLTLFVAIGILAAICEQIHYAANWKVVKEAQYQQALQVAERPGLLFTNAAGLGDRLIFSIRSYCANVEALLVLFWSIALFIGTWNLSLKPVRGYQDQISLGSKIFAITLPAIHQGIRQIPSLADSAVRYLFLVDSIIEVIFSFTVGTLFLMLTLYKYVKSRKVFKLFQASSAMSANNTVTSGSNPTVAHSTRLDADDKFLIIRFTIAFSILTAYSIILGMHQLRLYREYKLTDLGEGPNISRAFVMYECIADIPVVSNGIVMLFVFGTRRRFWQGHWEKCKGAWVGMRRRLRRPRSGGRREELPMHWNRMHSEDNCVELTRRPDKPQPNAQVTALPGHAM